MQPSRCHGARWGTCAISTLGSWKWVFSHRGIRMLWCHTKCFVFRYKSFRPLLRFWSFGHDNGWRFATRLLWCFIWLLDTICYCKYLMRLQHGIPWSLCESKWCYNRSVFHLLWMTLWPRAMEPWDCQNGVKIYGVVLTKSSHWEMTVERCCWMWGGR